MSEVDTSCAATAGCKRAPADGLMTCAGHYARLGQMLADVEVEAALLSAVPSMQARQGRGGGLASHRSPARLDAIVALDGRRGAPGLSDWSRNDAAAYDDTASILDVLHSWARVVREERNLTDRGPVTISGERDWLARHLEWACAQPWVDELYKDIGALLGQLRSVNGTAPDKPVGRCYLPVDAGSCDGPIWVDDASGHAHCGRCRATWDGPQLAHLKWELDRAAEEQRRPRTDDGRRMLTAEELVAQGYVSTVSNVRVQAHRRGKQAVGAYYDPDWFDKQSA